MAKAIITFKIMPQSPDVDLAAIEAAAKQKIEAAQGKVGKIEQEPVAFGLKAVMVTCMRDEELGDTESLEKELSSIENVASVMVAGVGRALG